MAQGGRYDSIGEVFGRYCPATGFTTDLKQIVALGAGANREASRGAVFAPRSDDPALDAMIQSLREAGERVICELSGQSATAAELGCDRLLRRQGDTWAVVAA